MPGPERGSHIVALGPIYYMGTWTLRVVIVPQGLGVVLLEGFGGFRKGLGGFRRGFGWVKEFRVSGV